MGGTSDPYGYPGKQNLQRCYNQTCLVFIGPTDPWAPIYGSGPELSVFYRDVLLSQYIASFGNIRKYRDTRGYHDIFTIFFMHDIGQFWPLIDL